MITEVYLPFADATADNQKREELQIKRITILSTVQNTGKALLEVVWTNGQLIAYFIDVA